MVVRSGNVIVKVTNGAGLVAPPGRLFRIVMTKTNYFLALSPMGGVSSVYQTAGSERAVRPTDTSRAYVVGFIAGIAAFGLALYLKLYGREWCDPETEEPRPEWLKWLLVVLVPFVTWFSVAAIMEQWMLTINVLPLPTQEEVPSADMGMEPAAPAPLVVPVRQ
jgi:hypothetical protein